MAMMGIIDEPQDRLQRIGNIKMGYKGEPKKNRAGTGTYRLPKKLDHFIVTTMERDPDTDDWLPDKDLMEILGEEPKSIPVMVPFHEIMDIIPHEFAWWKSSRRMCHGNGLIGLRYDEKTNTEKQMQCRCDKWTGEGGAERVCKKNGIMNVIITAAGRIGGVYQLRTTSGTTISNIKASINLIKSFSGGPVAGIPLMLTIQEQWAYPIIKGVKQKVKIFVAGLEFRADMKSSIPPGEQLLKAAYRQVQAQLSVHQNMLQIEQPSAGQINADTANDMVDWDQEFGEGAGPRSVEDEIDSKTGAKTDALKDRLEGATEGQFEDEPPPTESEPTPAEKIKNFQTEIETLLEEEILPKETVKKIRTWLKGKHHLKTWEGTRDKLVKTIDDLEAKAKEAPADKPTEDENRKAIRGDIAELMKSDALPKNTVTQLTEWLATEDLDADSLAECETKLIVLIQKYESEPEDLIPAAKSENDGKAEESPEAKPGRPSLAELGIQLADMMADAREKGLVDEQEHTDVFDQSDKLATAKEITDLHKKWSAEIDDRRSVREEEDKQASGK